MGFRDTKGGTKGDPVNTLERGLEALQGISGERTGNGGVEGANNPQIQALSVTTQNQVDFGILKNMLPLRSFRMIKSHAYCTNFGS